MTLLPVPIIAATATNVPLPCALFLGQPYVQMAPGSTPAASFCSAGERITMRERTAVRG
jgi:uncharacterized membrane protein